MSRKRTHQRVSAECSSPNSALGGLSTSTKTKRLSSAAFPTTQETVSKKKVKVDPQKTDDTIDCPEQQSTNGSEGDMAARDEGNKEAKVSDNVSTKCSDQSSSLSLKKMRQEDLRRYKEQLRQVETEIEQQQITRKIILQEMVDVWGVYRYGLAKIAALTDLSNAPDAVMPGNFPEQGL